MDEPNLTRQLAQMGTHIEYLKEQGDSNTKTLQQMALDARDTKSSAASAHKRLNVVEPVVTRLEAMKNKALSIITLVTFALGALFNWVFDALSGGGHG